MKNFINKLGKKKSIVESFGIILISIVAAFCVSTIFILMIGKNPLTIYNQLLFSPFMNMQNFGQVIKNAIPLIIIGVGVSFTSKCGIANLGGDGQFYMGALGMILVSLSVGKYLGHFSIILGMLLGALLGAVWASIAGIFKAYFKVSEIITTLMLNYIAKYLISFLVNGPLKAEGSSLPQTKQIEEYEMIPRLINGTTASYAIFIAIICIIIYWVVLSKTEFGFRLRTVGGSTKAAVYSGINPSKYYLKAMALSGLFAGFAGVIEICSVQYRLMEGISNNFGFNAVLVSLLGLLNPIGILLAAFLFASLSVGANIMQITCAVPVTLVSILQGLMVLFILFGISIRDRVPGKKSAIYGKLIKNKAEGRM